MSDTPRTDALLAPLRGSCAFTGPCAEHARQLERELNATVKALEKVWPFLEEDDGYCANAAHYQAAINAVKAVITTKKGEQP